MDWELVHELVVYGLAAVGVWHLAGIAFPGEVRGALRGRVRCGHGGDGGQR